MLREMLNFMIDIQSNVYYQLTMGYCDAFL